MSRFPERNRRQLLCAGLIASTSLTADCADESGMAYVEPDASYAEELDQSHSFADDERPTSPTPVAYELVPVITPLPPLSPSVKPWDESMDSAQLSAITRRHRRSQPALEVAQPAIESPKAGAQEDTAVISLLPLLKLVPHLPDLNLSAPSLTASEFHPLPGLLDAGLQEHATTRSAQTDESPIVTRRPLMQDNYISFGVNGR